MNQNSDFFKFESDFVDSLHCIPMIVRLKLDTCGIKLKLTHWNKFSQEERLILVKQPCQSNLEINNYRELLQNLVQKYTGEIAKNIEINPLPPWKNHLIIPNEVREKALEFNCQITSEQWFKLNDLQRFALIKLSRSKHENLNFLPALKEFKLI